MAVRTFLTPYDLGVRQMIDYDEIFQRVACPYCNADVGERCRTKAGRFTEWSHKARQEAARVVLGIEIPQTQAGEGTL